MGLRCAWEGGGLLSFGLCPGALPAWRSEGPFAFFLFSGNMVLSGRFLEATPGALTLGRALTLREIAGCCAQAQPSEPVRARPEAALSAGTRELLSPGREHSEKGPPRLRHQEAVRSVPGQGRCRGVADPRSGCYARQLILVPLHVDDSPSASLSLPKPI